jgi:hypothetical protein
MLFSVLFLTNSGRERNFLVRRDDLSCFDERKPGSERLASRKAE